jgi:CheY-like chemotaxis protein
MFSRDADVVTVIDERKGGHPMANPTKPASRLRVLYSEGDAEVLTSQAGVLQKAGHQVETAAGRKAAEEALRKSTFDLVVLGPTLSRNDRHHLPYMVKKLNSTTCVLVMHTDGERHHYVDANLDTGCTIENVVTKVAAMWPKRETAAAAAAGR